MASNRRIARRDSRFVYGIHLSLTLLTLCLAFQILRPTAFTSATPINHLAQRRRDSGSNGPSSYYGDIGTNVESSETIKRNFRDGLNLAFEDLGSTTKSIFDPDIDLDENSKRDVVESFKAAFDDLGDTIKSIFHPSDKTPVEAVSEYAYNEVNHQIPLKELKKAFEKTYREVKHSGNKQADDDHWILDQVENVIPELKNKFDEANKSDSASKHHERDTGEGFKTIIKDFGIKTRANFVYEGENMPAVDWISQYAYDKLNHYFPLKELKDRFEKSHEAMGQEGNQTADAIWINEEIDNELPKLKEIYKASKTDTASQHHEGDAGDKRRPMPRGDDYYTSPHFFPYPTSPIPTIPDELKASLGDAFNKWQANATKIHSHYDKGIAARDAAEAIMPEGDPTSMAKRKEIVEACISFLIDHPSGLGKYYSENALKPYLAELVDQGKIKDEDGKIKKFYKRGKANAGVSDTAKPVLSQDFLNILTTAYKKYKYDLANHSDMSCPLTKENACENPNHAVAAVPNATNQRSLETCVVFLGWHPNCLLRYEAKDFIKPYLEDPAAGGKIDERATNSSSTGNSTGFDYEAAVQGLAKTLLELLRSVSSESVTSDTQDTVNVCVQARSQGGDVRLGDGSGIRKSNEEVFRNFLSTASKPNGTHETA